MNNILLLKDLARKTGFSIHTLKYYLKIGLLKEAGRSPETNFRYFNQESIERLRKIRALRRQGRSLKEIQLMLR